MFAVVGGAGGGQSWRRLQVEFESERGIWKELNWCRSAQSTAIALLCFHSTLLLTICGLLPAALVNNRVLGIGWTILLLFCKTEVK